ncbi:MAG: CPBP family intramembrane metalloprotease, partial [Caldilineaceae bacterium]|nr:CPBP family intramembrane metalloprotease [Caldilineaceae bacterium]
MSIVTKGNARAGMNATLALVKFLCGFAVLYGVLEGTARLLGDALRPENTLLITGAVLVAALAVEIGLFQQSWQAVPRALGLGWPGWRAMGIALVISAVQLAAYPFISWLTGYHWTLPVNWQWIMVGVFALHGVAEEVVYRAYLFGRLRHGRSFWRAAWLAVILFALSHLPILATQGLLVGGMAVALAIASSFPFARLYEQGRNT